MSAQEQSRPRRKNGVLARSSRCRGSLQLREAGTGAHGGRARQLLRGTAPVSPAGESGLLGVRGMWAQLSSENGRGGEGGDVQKGREGSGEGPG